MTTHKLEVIAPSNEPVIITHRFFKASPALLFKMWTTPEHMKQWLGPRDMVMTECEVDLRVGGGTLVTTHSRHPSLEARNGHLNGGMEHGMSEGYERLEALIEKLQGRGPGRPARTTSWTG
jgi:uncharacterized protein YndB with AHSA1/START domain